MYKLVILPVDDAEQLLIYSLIQTFSKKKWFQKFRWLFGQPLMTWLLREINVSTKTRDPLTPHQQIRFQVAIFDSPNPNWLRVHFVAKWAVCSLKQIGG